MNERRKRQQPKVFDIHRTLPNKHQTHEVYRPPRPIKVETPKQKRRFGWKRAALLIFTILLIPLLVIGIWDYRNFSSASEKIFGSSNVISLLNSSELEGAAAGRVNLLLVGYSIDDPGHAGATLTDSILVMSLSTRNQTGYMLSIPRDLYVNIPGFGYSKINEAYQDGENIQFNEAGYSAGGMGLLEKVISENFKIPIHYNSLINYNAVRDMVSSLDGISIDIKSSDQRGLYDPNFRPQEGGPLKLLNGPQNIDAQTALNLTRARGATFGSYGFEQADFARTQHQRQILTAIKEKLTWLRILQPQKNKPLFDAAGNNVKTDIKIGEILPLYRLFNSVPNDKLQSVSLRNVNGINLLASYRGEDGQSALVPAAGIDDYSEIHDAILRLNQ